MQTAGVIIRQTGYTNYNAELAEWWLGERMTVLASCIQHWIEDLRSQDESVNLTIVDSIIDSLQEDLLALNIELEVLTGRAEEIPGTKLSFGYFDKTRKLLLLDAVCSDEAGLLKMRRMFRPSTIGAHTQQFYVVIDLADLRIGTAVLTSGIIHRTADLAPEAREAILCAR